MSRHTPHQRLLAGEQKLVTVLVCTLAQAAAWSQRLEAEVWHQALQAFFTASLEEIQRYGGTLQHLQDDGLLVLFGAPVAQEDHARRAVRAALGLQQRLRRVHVDPAWPSGRGVRRLPGTAYGADPPRQSWRRWAPDLHRSGGHDAARHLARPAGGARDHPGQ